MNCSMTGRPCRHPVVSVKSGHVFERALVEEHLRATGTCPATGEPLSEGDLLVVRQSEDAAGAAPPRPPGIASVPDVLRLLQAEWDAAMLEQHGLRAELKQTREQLAEALYRYDAATRVIARLTAERDEARAAAGAAPAAGAAQAPPAATAAPAPASNGAPAAGATLPAAALDQLMGTAKGLVKTRGARVKAARKRCAPADAVRKYAASGAALPLHGVQRPGVSCLDVFAGEGELAGAVATGGVDGSAAVVVRGSGGALRTLAGGHGERLSAVRFHPSDPSVLYTASRDTTLGVWRGEERVSVLQGHGTPLVACAAHPRGSHALSAEQGGAWRLWDVERGAEVLARGASDDDRYAAAGLHPDGLLVAAGTAGGLVRVYDMTQGAASPVATLDGGRGAAGAVGAMSFCENGYWLAAGGADGAVLLWDLRFLNNPAQVVHEGAGGDPVSALAFDGAGKFLAAGAGQSTLVYSTKPWGLAATLDGHAAAVTGAGFGPDASFVATASMDRTLQFYGAAE